MNFSNIQEYVHLCLSNYLNFFFLLTPFFVLATFISLTEELEYKIKRKLAYRIALSVAICSLLIFFLGTYIMKLFGITEDAFRAGSGVLLILTAINLVAGKNTSLTARNPQELFDMAVVPLAVPVTAGPATLGALMVMGCNTVGLTRKLTLALSIILASFSIGFMLSISDKIIKFLGHSNVSLLSKITGLILSAIAMQMICIGVKNLWLN